MNKSLQENSNVKILKDVEFIETIDLTNLALGDLEIELPNFYQKLIELRAQNNSAVTKNIHVKLTNSAHKAFGGRDSYPADWLIIAFLIEYENLKINRVTFQVTNKVPFLNTIVVYFYHPDLFPPDYELSQEIGRINWLQIDSSLWGSYWTKDVKLTYNLQFES